MKVLTLDYNKWRCGSDGKNKVGEGTTALLNDEGFMCCLGQFSLQLGENMNTQDILGKGEPAELGREISFLSKTEEAETFDWESGDDSPYTVVETYNTDISDEAIEINDDENTTPDEKISLLKSLFKQVDVDIEVINKN